MTSAPFAFECFMAFMSTTTLALGVPSAVVTLPILPIPLTLRRHVNHVLASRVLLYAAAVILAVLPSAVSRAMSYLLMLLAFLGTFTVPGKCLSPSRCRLVLGS